MTLVDSHCHIHEAGYPLSPVEVIERAHQAGVDKMIVVGTDLESSRQAVAFAGAHTGIAAAIGVHPHEARHFIDGDQLLALSELVPLAATTGANLVAIGEIGLDYFYEHSPRSVQIKAFELQLQLAVDTQLPVIFHVRDGFADFWPVIDNFPGVRGVLHSFTDNRVNLEKGLARGFYIGVNGISTFTKDSAQKDLFASIPLDRLLLETDAPFLTPSPLRGKMNEPAFVEYVAQNQAMMRQIPLDVVQRETTANAHALFAI